MIEIDPGNDKHRIVHAALTLAASEGWNNLTLCRISAAANVPFHTFRRHFQTKPQILAAFTRMIDDAVMAKASDVIDSARERLFDVLMTRFDMMTSYKPSLKRIRDDLRTRPGEAVVQLFTTSRSQYWMLEAAGIDAEGPRGAMRVPGVTAIYLKAFDTWLDDDDPGLAKTMAALDGRLRQGEKFMRKLHDVRSAAERFCNVFAPSRCKPKQPAPQGEPPVAAAAPSPAPVSSAPQGNA